MERSWSRTPRPLNTLLNLSGRMISSPFMPIPLCGAVLAGVMHTSACYACQIQCRGLSLRVPGVRRPVAAIVRLPFVTYLLFAQCSVRLLWRVAGNGFGVRHRTAFGSVRCAVMIAVPTALAVLVSRVRPDSFWMMMVTRGTSAAVATSLPSRARIQPVPTRLECQPSVAATAVGLATVARNASALHILPIIGSARLKPSAGSAWLKGKCLLSRSRRGLFVLVYRFVRPSCPLRKNVWTER
mmetsp:Transcript_28735/g.63260  ORF Transcript_28735/g.63260 Transcript_28735/m.63260 type:complete len:241 (-) Transcript_28735:373-1095(-)